jgi:hypothetical protein
MLLASQAIVCSTQARIPHTIFSNEGNQLLSKVNYLEKEKEKRKREENGHDRSNQKMPVPYQDSNHTARCLSSSGCTERIDCHFMSRHLCLREADAYCPPP